MTNPEAGGNLTNQRAETKLKFIELYNSMWSYIVVVWFISSSIDGFLDFPVYNELRRKFPTPSQWLSRLTTDVISHKVPQFKPSLIRGEGRKHLKCKARRENITGEVSTLTV